MGPDPAGPRCAISGSILIGASGRWPIPEGLRGYSHDMPDTLRLRPMTDAEFALFRTRAVRDYAADKVKAGEWPPERSEGLAEAQTDQLLPEGTRTPGMLLLMAETEQDGPVGYAWLALAGPEVASVDRDVVDPGLFQAVQQRPLPAKTFNPIEPQPC